jgi:invasion protein IalB
MATKATKPATVTLGTKQYNVLPKPTNARALQGTWQFVCTAGNFTNKPCVVRGNPTTINNATTAAAIAAAQVKAGVPLTYAQVQAICKGLGHSSFAGYYATSGACYLVAQPA